MCKTLSKLLEEVSAIRFMMTRPGRLGVRVTKESGDMLNFVVSLPPIAAADVVNRELSVKIADAEPVIVSPAIEAGESQEFAGVDNDAVHLELVDIDDAGNRSEPSVLDAVLLDTLAPPAPGEMGVRVVSET